MRNLFASLFVAWLACAGLSLPCFAQAPAPIANASLVSTVTAVEAGKPFYLALKLELPAGWHTYWENPGDSGAATIIEPLLPEGFKAAPIHWPVPHRVDTSGIISFGYEGTAYHFLPVTPPDTMVDVPLTFRVNAEWLVCKDICIPETAELTLTLPSGAAVETQDEELKQALASLPKPLAGEAVFYISRDGEQRQLHIKTPIPESLAIVSLHFYPQADGIASNREEAAWKQQGKALELTIPAGSVTDASSLPFVIAGNTKDGTRFAYQLTAETAIGEIEQTNTPASGISGVLVAVLFAFVGGVLLNVMPCVLPVLSLKALSLIRHGSSSAVRKDALAYTAGILVCFAALGALFFVLREAGHSVGWGFQLQEPRFVILMLCAMLLIGFNLSGLFQLPSISIHHHRQDALGSFLMGLLVTFVATPCTVPFMAPALGYAITQPLAVGMAIFLSLGLGLAAPYLAIAFLPSARRLLPRPGAWMQDFKQLMAFPIYASGAWLYWVVAQQIDPVAQARVLAALVLLGFLAWLMGRNGWRRHRWVLLVLVIAVLLFATSGHRVVETPHPSSAQTSAFSEATLAELRAQNVPVFVDATAAWCLTCKVNERVALRDSRVQEAFAANGVRLLVADWTRRDEVIRNYLAGFGRNGVPLYVYYPPGGEPIVLPQLLTPSIVLSTLASGEAS